MDGFLAAQSFHRQQSSQFALLPGFRTPRHAQQVGPVQASPDDHAGETTPLAQAVYLSVAPAKAGDDFTGHKICAQAQLFPAHGYFANTQCQAVVGGTGKNTDGDGVGAIGGHGQLLEF